MKAITLNVANIPGTEFCVGSKEPTVVDMVHRFSNLGAVHRVCRSNSSAKLAASAEQGIPETSKGPDPDLASTEAQNIKNEHPSVFIIRTLYELLCLSSWCRCSLDQGASARAVCMWIWNCPISRLRLSAPPSTLSTPRGIMPNPIGNTDGGIDLVYRG